MTELDPDVVALLAPLMEGGLAALATTVVEFIESTDEVLPTDFEGQKLRIRKRITEPFAPGPDENADQRRARQLAIANHVVSTTIRREIAITKRLQIIQREWPSEAIDAPRIEKICITPTQPDQGDDLESLISNTRVDALSKFLGVWTEAYQVAVKDVDAGR